MSPPQLGSRGAVNREPSAGFVVKLRDVRTRSWGNETEVVATTALEAAERVAAGEHLLEGPGERSRLRARVWKTPYGSVPEMLFYVAGGA
jgi:hypothetical protein